MQCVREFHGQWYWCDVITFGVWTNVIFCFSLLVKTLHFTSGLLTFSLFSSLIWWMMQAFTHIFTQTQTHARNCIRQPKSGYVHQWHPSPITRICLYPFVYAHPFAIQYTNHSFRSQRKRRTWSDVGLSSISVFWPFVHGQKTHCARRVSCWFCSLFGEFIEKTNATKPFSYGDVIRPKMNASICMRSHLWNGFSHRNRAARLTIEQIDCQ